MTGDDTIPNTIDAGIAAAMATCVAHATDLFESAKLVRESGPANIADHLAALALEELGRRELLGVETIAGTSATPPAWPMKATQDHVKKLFWCFFGGNFLAERITKETFENMIGLARRIQATTSPRRFVFSLMRLGARPKIATVRSRWSPSSRAISATR